MAVGIFRLKRAMSIGLPAGAVISIDLDGVEDVGVHATFTGVDASYNPATTTTTITYTITLDQTVTADVYAQIVSGNTVTNLNSRLGQQFTANVPRSFTEQVVNPQPGTYTYKAATQVGTSYFDSDPVTVVVPQVQQPQNPTAGVAATFNSTTRIASVTWTAPLTGTVRVSWRTASGATEVVVTNADGQHTFATAVPTTSSTTTVSVEAPNGLGGYYAPVSVLLNTPAPVDPTITVSAQAVDADSIKVSYTFSGATLSSVVATHDGTTLDGAVPLQKNVSAATQSAQFDNMRQLDYTFTFTFSLTDGRVFTRTVKGRPTPAQIQVALVPGINRIDATWNLPNGAVSSTAGRNGTDSGGGGAWTSPAITAPNNTQDFTFLDPAQTYTITVKVTMSDGVILTGQAQAQPMVDPNQNPNPPVVFPSGSRRLVPPNAGALVPDWIDDLVESMSITMHANYADYNTVRDLVAPAFRDLGIRYFRDGGPNDQVWKDKLTWLSQNGARGCITCDPRDNMNPDTIVAALKFFGPEKIWAVEGPNELDNNRQVSWGSLGTLYPVTEVTYQQMMYDRIRADSALSKIYVVTPSMATPENTGNVGVVKADVTNIHHYQGGALPMDQFKTRWTNNSDRWEVRSGTGVRPMISTETGYHLLASLAGQPGITMNAAKKYVPRLYLGYFRQSKLDQRWYGASLYNMSTDNWSVMLSNAGAKTPAYLATQAMVQLMSDYSPTRPTVPTTFPGTITTGAADVQYLPFWKRDGSFWMVMWRETKSCNQGALTDISVPRVNCTVTTTTNKTGTVYRPSTTLNTAADGSTSGTSHVVAVGDEPTLLKLV